LETDGSGHSLHLIDPFNSTRHKRFSCVLPGLDEVHLTRVAFASVGKRSVLEQPDDLGLVTVVRPSVATAVCVDETMAHSVFDPLVIAQHLSHFATCRLDFVATELRAGEKVPIDDPGRPGGQVAAEMIEVKNVDSPSRQPAPRRSRDRARVLCPTPLP